MKRGSSSHKKGIVKDTLKKWKFSNEAHVAFLINGSPWLSSLREKNVLKSFKMKNKNP